MSNPENKLADIIKNSKIASNKTNSSLFPDKPESKNINFNLLGVAYLRVINTPQYLNQLAREAYSIFEHPDALDSAIKILFTKEPDKESFITPALKNKANEVLSKYAFTGGTFVEFITCKADFELKDKFPIVHDILSEITIKDGIVTKIEPTNLARAYDQGNKKPKK